jgi:hypothetical protein
MKRENNYKTPIQLWQLENYLASSNVLTKILEIKKQLCNTLEVAVSHF